MNGLNDVRALTFDLFGTVLDLDESLVPPLRRLFEARGIAADPTEFWARWRARQRLEQYQDNILMLGHSGYLATCRRALRYIVRLQRLDFDQQTEDLIMAFWQDLNTYPEVLDALTQLSERYDLIALSNGDPDYLDHLVQRCIRWSFDEVLSVEAVGAFKPHPGVYRAAAAKLGLEPAECLMVSANSFDVLGARACGFRGAFVNRADLPYEDSVLVPDLTVTNFTELARALL